MAPKMVRLSQVGKRYPNKRYALREVSFDLQQGEFAYVTGVSGAGKSTLLKLLFAMERPSEGDIQINAHNLSKLSKRKVPQLRRGIGFVFQDFKLLPDLTVFENVSLPLDIKSMSREEAEFRVTGVLALVGLEDRAKDYPVSLSGGEQQRIAIARAIISRPFLLLADEPTGNLDRGTADDIMSLFFEIRDMGTTVLIATHDDRLIENFPARIIELEGGRMISDREGIA